MVQGRRLEPADIDWIRRLISDHPDWHRKRLSQELCLEWGWHNARGLMKDMAARSLMLKLEARGLIQLPSPRRKAPERILRLRASGEIRDMAPVTGDLRDLGKLQVLEVSSDVGARRRFAAALFEFHYLGCRGTVGENLRYTVTDHTGRLLACLLFGSAAWKCRPRDEFIGWTPHQRQGRLHLITNNTRFLILPFVKVPHLASWILGRVLRRLSGDWEMKYGHPIVLVETFVERDRFPGTSYKAANWVRVGATTGRGRQDRDHTMRVPVKDIYVYPLRRGFRGELSV